MKVKICGITSLADALVCAQAGADLLGFNFYPRSPRYVLPQACASMVSAVRQEYPALRMVGVFVNESAETIHAILHDCGLDMAQCSGDEPPSLLDTLQAAGPCAFKALRPAGLDEMEEAIGSYPARLAPPAFLIDASQPGAYGGTGLPADWYLASVVAARLPILLAGGLTPENVAVAIRQVYPWGVDVASGVESAPGRKDPHKVQAFIHAANL